MIARRATQYVTVGLMSLLVVTVIGCSGIPTRSERSARANVAKVQGKLVLDRSLPKLTAESHLEDFVRFAMLNRPAVTASYLDWVASVQRITVERSLPDPRLTFSTDIQEVVMGVMPGLMVDLPGPGKLCAAAAVASAESEARYFDFEAAVLKGAFEVKRAYYQLYFLEQRVAVNRDTLLLLRDVEKLARTQNEVGKATLQDVLRAQIEAERLETEIINLEDSRAALLAELKAALGLTASESAPPVPKEFVSTELRISLDELWAVAVKRNPRLQRMAGEVRAAEAFITVARRSRVPDFSAGIEADVKANPVFFTPSLGVTLPIWRDKIAAQIAAAQANKRAAEARLTGEEIDLAVEFAGRSFMLRESTRNVSLLSERLLPKARQSLEVARSSYAAGKSGYLDLTDAQRTVLEFQLAEIEARAQRELALAELSLLIGGIAPSGAPLLAPATKGTQP
jgi:cobalt-zinc-cadmium efflux system outer membrane protein